MHVGARAIEARVIEAPAAVAHPSNKHLGLSLSAQPYLFGFCKRGVLAGKLRDTLMRSIPPTGNVLPGYTPSFAMNRVLEDAAA
jgi:RNA ligase